jgi:hypothetical protein
MKNYNSKIPLISIHIPKCGGSSLKEVLKEWFNDRLFFHYYDLKNNKMPPKIKTRNLFYRYVPDICIHGHFNKFDGLGVKEYYPNIDQAITFIRDPLEVQLSVFYYRHQQDKQGLFNRSGKPMNLTLDIDEFLETSTPYIHNFFPDDFNVETFEKYINNYFIHIGIIEDYQNSLNILADKLNKPRIKVPHINSSERFSKPSESSIKKFKEKCKWEYEIYNRAHWENEKNK